MDKEECTRVWISDSGMAWRCHPKNCVFCDNCTDIWYDSNGPYVIECTKNLSQATGLKGQCKYFKEEKPEEISIEEYLNFQQAISKLYEEHKKEIDKAYKEYINDLINSLPYASDIQLGDKQ